MRPRPTAATACARCPSSRAAAAAPIPSIRASRSRHGIRCAWFTMPRLALPTLVALAVLAAPHPSRTQPVDTQRVDAPEVTRLVVDETNAFRRAQGLKPVAANPLLADTAREFARYMADTDRYGHKADGREPSQRAGAHGYGYCMVSENIAWQYSSKGFNGRELAQDFVEGWKKSPGHRRNMP